MTLVMDPAPGERILRFVGDRLRFFLSQPEGIASDGSRAFLRTTLGRAGLVRLEVLGGHGSDRAVDGTAWRNLPMHPTADGWEVELTVTEPGYFRAKAFALDNRGFQVWPSGPDVGVTVHPDSVRTANTIYCAFTRLFGSKAPPQDTSHRRRESNLRQLETEGCTVLPASGTLRDLTRALPHILGTLGCRILHLLPVNPVPTTYARFGRFGSPYASLDLTGIDPALVEFDRRTTGIDQFRELAYAVHARGARLFLDLVINHTGWGSRLQEHHPEWFRRNPDGTFRSPGAWGTTWEDLIELEGTHRDLWEHIAEALLTWCRRGVDGFRCDAGYMVPMAVWRYLIARVRDEFPDTIFLLEGLGGAWEITENLLTEGGMQWAYSELFQEFSGTQIASYLDHAHRQSHRVGVLVHYSETHDNNRLASKGRAWSLLRNRLSALTSVSGGFGFTCGVEWLATERILVHGRTSLAWDNPNHLIAELAQLNRVLAEHPCFFDQAKLSRLSPPTHTIYALRRDSAEGLDHVLVLINTDPEHAHTLRLPRESLDPIVRNTGPLHDLLCDAAFPCRPQDDGTVEFQLEPGAAVALSPTPNPRGLAGDTYRQTRARADFLIKILRTRFDPEEIGPFDFRQLAALVDADPHACVGALTAIDPAALQRDVLAALTRAVAAGCYRPVIRWNHTDTRRITPVPADHWVLVEDEVPFRARLDGPAAHRSRHGVSISVRHGHVACFPPPGNAGDATMVLERFETRQTATTGALRYLESTPGHQAAARPPDPAKPAIALLTNGRGAMTRLSVDLGLVTSKYDCLLAANLHPSFPVDRHVLAKRLRLWVNAFGFISPLNGANLLEFDAGPPARWVFRANAGDGRTVDIELCIVLRANQNTVLIQLRHLSTGVLAAAARAKTAEGLDGVHVTGRVDLEDRSFHGETRRNGAAEHHFSTHLRPLTKRPGFEFTPAPDRQLLVFSSAGRYHPEPEWCENIPHPIEASRGQTGQGDAYSPGWFDLPLAQDDAVCLTVTAQPDTPQPDTVAPLYPPQPHPPPVLHGDDPFATRLARAARDFIVRRDDVRTVIAGYPWFLDWGRDTLICARGFIAAGWFEVVRDLLVAFGRFEEHGTLPNTIHGHTAGNRDTSDAPLWYALVCEELAAATGDPAAVFALHVNPAGRTVADVLSSIATHYLQGTPNGIFTDPESALVFSPSHFTWMDTNHPAGTPREGYPVEIQALWIRLLRLLHRLNLPAPHQPWASLAHKAEDSFARFFWLEKAGCLADLLIAHRDMAASAATRDTALRSNQLLAISLGLVLAERARSTVTACQRHLLVPGALRSLAPLPVSPPLAIHSADGRLLNHPEFPYWGRYEGDEDACRKPAYHNGTAWVWTLPAFCEALAMAWDFSPEAITAARAYLLATDQLLTEGCLGQLPEILDGDAPHGQRGCDAQAWSATETLRVWCRLQRDTSPLTLGAPESAP
jgi:starch synthase (maltosyl-transferring)